MNNYELICAKLEAFIRKYYTNELIKGAILFFATGLLYFLLLVFLEYFFWLGKTGRTILFWSFIIVEIGLLFQFVLLPIFRLFKLSKGIDYEAASTIIGNHFPEVNDKLLNVLQLKQQNENSDLLLAGIDQKAAELKPVPFHFAVDFKGNLKYVKYAIVPILVILTIYISGKSTLFSDSYKRIVHYEKAYEPPAPFRFLIGNENLHAKQNEAFTLKIFTKGKVVPEDVSIHFNEETYFLKPISPGVFEYSFEKITDPVSFYLSANEVRSRNYKLKMVEVPTLLDFEMQLDYPAYTLKNDETIKGSGNAVFPEGTQITWKLTTRSTQKVELRLQDTTQLFEKNGDNFRFQQRIYRNTAYQISTSNEAVRDYEKLSYSLTAIKDEFPTIELMMKIDSLDHKSMYFHGKVSDDYGLTKLELVYYPIKTPKAKKKKPVAVSTSTFDEFLYAFPDTLQLEKGTAYEFYFQVFDNDGIHGAKKAKSELFSFRKLSDAEKEAKLLENQKNALQGMDKSLEKLEESEQEISELNRMQKEQKQWSYTDRKKLENFLERQKKQREMMLDYNKKLQNNLEEFQPEQEDPYKKELQERLERNEKKLKENEELLKKLEEYAKKINKENLGKELEELAKQNINQQKNLEQLLELTKRYYVEQKAQKIADDLQRLAKKQEELSQKGEENTKAAQDSLTKKFDALKKEMDALKKENQGLKKPMELGIEKQKEQEISEAQKQAGEKLQQSEQSENKNQQQKSKSAAQKQQQNAAEKMKKLGQQMQSQMMMASSKGMQEDAEMLRQILDNLITFSFQQENLMEDFQKIQERNPVYVEKLKRQNQLRTNFEHVDDSLFALALRNPMISGKITEKLTDVAFNIDKSIERLAENQIRQAVGSQQYTITGANDLALMLDRALSQMQMQMKGMGMGKGKKGQGRGFQLPDIIKKQGQLGEKMKQGMQKGKSGQGKKGETGEGNKGKNGNGKQGKSGNGNGNGNNGSKPGNKDGKNGKGQEGMSGELYEIYKQQQLLRKALEDKIRQLGLGRDAKQLAKQMEQIENELLLKGFNEQTLQKIMALQHQLMKLEKATYKQGKDNKRQSSTNFDTFENTSKANLLKAKEYFNTTEILNRQRLPLRQNYQELVEEYFQENKD
ncbi:MAG TPA: DUF4175 family protein [Flavobacteriaceae bacterium]|nr:DUF4175 family protein [Flavobacteriaceae bacterium]